MLTEADTRGVVAANTESLGSTRRSAASDYSLSLRCVARVTYPLHGQAPGPPSRHSRRADRAERASKAIEDGPALDRAKPDELKQAIEPTLLDTVLKGAAVWVQLVERLR